MSLTNATIFTPDNSVPANVVREVDNRLAPDFNASDDTYISWNSSVNGDKYPAINSYLLAKGITKCLIRIYW